MVHRSQVVIGYGEVGQALKEVLACDCHDPYKHMVAPKKQYDVIHIAIPYTPTFIRHVKSYQKLFKPTLTIIHSSVPVGTSRKLGAVHSPVRGVHPHIAKGIKTFVKFFGGKDAKQAAKLFKNRGINVYVTLLSETTEALKLWDTTQYGVLIALEKEINAYCKTFGLDADVVYRLSNQTYNEGYIKLGRHEVLRPYLKHVDGPIGGHCIIPNARLLHSPSAKSLIKKNTLYKTQKKIK